MQIFILAWVSGVIYQLLISKNLMPIFDNLALLCFGIIGQILLGCLDLSKLSRIKFLICAISLAFTIGWAWSGVYVNLLTAWVLPDSYETQDCLVRGYIASLPKVEEYGVKFSFVVQTIELKSKVPHEKIPKINRFFFSPKLLISWTDEQLPNLKVGDNWQLVVKLKKLHGLKNFGNHFFQDQSYLAQNIRAVGYVKVSEFNRKYAEKWYILPLDRLRQRLAQAIINALPNNRFTGVLTAITVGSYNELSEDDWRILRNTGTVHLVAIAGLHVGLVAALAYCLLNFSWRMLPRLPLIFPASDIAKIGALIFAFIYSGLAGFALPTQRTLLMMVILTFTILKRQRLLAWQTWLIALFITLVANPLLIFTVGFWLSFMTVASLIYTFSGRFGRHRRWATIIKLQWVITWSIMPLCLWWFQQFGLLSFFANLIVVPIFGGIVVPLTLSGCISLLVNVHLAAWLWEMATKILAILWIYLQWLAGQSWAIWQHAIFNYGVLISVIIGLFLCFAPRGIPGRCLGLMLVLPLVLFKPAKPQFQEIWFFLLDVGQGLASVVVTSNHVLVYDTGPKFSKSFNAGDAVVLPFLRWRGIRYIDMLVLSHGDNDHVGGALSILQNLTVGKVLTSVPNLFTKFEAQHCWENQSWQWDGVTFKFLSPALNGDFSGNDASCVLRITANGKSLLLTGDIEKSTESWLVAKHPADLIATLLVAPHHGSQTSLADDFIKLVSPKYVLFSTGYLNHFHFPNNKVLTQYRLFGALEFNTAYDGALGYFSKNDLLKRVRGGLRFLSFGNSTALGARLAARNQF